MHVVINFVYAIYGHTHINDMYILDHIGMFSHPVKQCQVKVTVSVFRDPPSPGRLNAKTTAVPPI